MPTTSATAAASAARPRRPNRPHPTGQRPRAKVGSPSKLHDDVKRVTASRAIVVDTTEDERASMLVAPARELVIRQPQRAQNPGIECPSRDGLRRLGGERE